MSLSRPHSAARLGAACVTALAGALIVFAAGSGPALPSPAARAGEPAPGLLTAEAIAPGAPAPSAAAREDSAAAAADSARQAPYLVACRPEGSYVIDSVRVLAQLDLEPSGDIAPGVGGILVMAQDGSLTLLAGDSLRVTPFSGDLPAAGWPEAVSAEGRDWLILMPADRRLVRLGPRGERLGDLALPPDTGPFWWGLRGDRSGRIWLAESDDEILVLSRAGQLLDRWPLGRMLPGYKGPVRAWCPDERGGLYVAEGGPLRLHHVNAAGNVLRTWAAGVTALNVAIAPDLAAGTGVILAPEGDKGPPVLRLDARGRLLMLSPGSRLRILSVDTERP